MAYSLLGIRQLNLSVSKRVQLLINLFSGYQRNIPDLVISISVLLTPETAAIPEAKAHQVLHLCRCWQELDRAVVISCSSLKSLFGERNFNAFSINMAQFTMPLE